MQLESILMAFALATRGLDIASRCVTERDTKHICTC
jgi:hypothetical protein